MHEKLSMAVTIKISETKEYSFLEIVDAKDDDLSNEQKRELDHRYEHFENHKDEYANWEDVMHKYEV